MRKPAPRPRLCVETLEDRVTPVRGFFTENFTYDPIETFRGFDSYDNDPNTFSPDAFGIDNNLENTQIFGFFPPGAPTGEAGYAQVSTDTDAPRSDFTYDIYRVGTIPLTFSYPPPGSGGGPASDEAVGGATAYVRFTGEVTFEGLGGDLVVPFDSQTWTEVSARFDTPIGGNRFLGEIFRVTVSAVGEFSSNFVRTNGITFEVVDALTGGGNSAPVAVNDERYIDPATGSVTFDAAANDTDPDGDTLAVTGVSAPQYGTATTTGYTLLPQYRDDPTITRDTYTYIVSDGGGMTAAGTVTILLDRPPVGADDEYLMPHYQAGPLVVSDPALGVLANDTDANGDALTATLVTGPTRGAVHLNPDGTFTYASSRADGLIAADEFTYRVSDGNSPNTAAFHKVVRVGSVNVAPELATRARFSVLAGRTTPLAEQFALRDPDGDPLRVEVTRFPRFGGLVLNNGQPLDAVDPEFGRMPFAYTPHGGSFTAGDSFEVTATDVYGAAATIEIRIDVGDRVPVATTQVFAANHGDPGPFRFELTYTEADGQPVTVTVVDPPDHGTVVFGYANGRIQATYTPQYTIGDNTRLLGSDRFTYRLSDGSLSSNAVEAVISVPNRPPTPLPDRFHFPVVTRNTATGFLDSVENLNDYYRVDYNVVTNSFDPSSYNGLANIDIIDNSLENVPLRNIVVDGVGIPTSPTADSRQTARDFDQDGDSLHAYIPNGQFETRFGRVTLFRPDGSFRYQNQTGFLFSYVGEMPVDPRIIETTVQGYQLFAADIDNLLRVYGLPQDAGDVLAGLTGRPFRSQSAFVDAIGPRYAVGGDLFGFRNDVVILARHPVVVQEVLGDDGVLYDASRIEYKPYGVDYFTYALTDGHTVREARVTLVFGQRGPDHTFYDLPHPIIVLSPNDAANVPRATDEGVFPRLVGREGVYTESASQGTFDALSGDIRYTAGAAAAGLDRARYYVSNGDRARFVDRYYLVTRVHLDATNEQYAARRNLPLEVSAVAGMLRNERPAYGDALRIDRVGTPSKGTVRSWTQDGGFVYVAFDGATGTDSFTYRIIDDFGNVAEGTVTVTIYDAAAGDIRYDFVDGRQLVLISPPGTLITHFDVYPAPTTGPNRPPAHVVTPYGMIDFQIDGVSVGGRTTVTLLLPTDGPRITSYWKYGYVPRFNGDGWFNFAYDPATGLGAEILSDRVVITIQDGGLGDTDRQRNGSVRDPGGPADVTGDVPFVGDTTFTATAGPVVRVLGPDGAQQRSLMPFGETYASTIQALSLDFNGDGVPDLAVGTGPGSVAQVRVIDGATGADLFADLAVFGDFTGGVHLAAGDITGDGIPDLVVTPDIGGGPRVRVFRGGDFVPIADFLGIDDPDFRGGVRPAVGDVDGDGFADLGVAAGAGGGSRVAIYSGRLLADGQLTRLVADFFAFNGDLRDGAYLALGDVDGDGLGDVVAGAGDGGSPHVKVFGGLQLMNTGDAESSAVASFFTGDPADRRGVRVALAYLDEDNAIDIVTADAGRVGGYFGPLAASSGEPDAFWFPADDPRGVFVG